VTRVSAVVLAVLAAVVLTASAAGATAPPEPPPTNALENSFLPEEQDLSDCVNALPRPECGSEARGGWRQAAVFGLVVAGGAFIAWRVVRSLRRREATPGRASASEPPGDGVRGRSPRGE
jgi:hypothetical protein